jgi:hypothetical protein
MSSKIIRAGSALRKDGLRIGLTNLINGTEYTGTVCDQMHPFRAMRHDEGCRKGFVQSPAQGKKFKRAMSKEQGTLRLTRSYWQDNSALVATLAKSPAIEFSSAANPSAPLTLVICSHHTPFAIAFGRFSRSHGEDRLMHGAEYSLLLTAAQQPPQAIPVVRSV